MIANGLTEEELNSKNVIYCAKFPNGKMYIGLTTRKLKYRIREHYKECSDGKCKLLFHSAINKYGKENINWSILDRTEDKSELNSLEIKYIKELNTFIEDSLCNGYNMTIGGEFTAWTEKQKESYRGSKNPSAILDDLQVEDIKTRLYNSESITTIATYYGVDRRVIGHIKSTKIWKHIKPEYNNVIKSKIISIESVKDRILEIKTLMYNGKTNSEISKLLNIKVSMLSAIRTGFRYNNVLPEYNEKIQSISISRARFKDEDVSLIKKLLCEGKVFKDIAKLFNMECTGGFKTRIRDIMYLNRFIDVGVVYNEDLRRIYGKA